MKSENELTWHLKFKSFEMKKISPNNGCLKYLLIVRCRIMNDHYFKKALNFNTIMTK